MRRDLSRGLTLVVSTSDASDRAGVLATFFTAGYAGISLPVIGVGVALQHVSPRVTLLIFALAVGLGILAATPTLIRRTEAPRQPEPASDPMTEMCCCFGAEAPGGQHDHQRPDDRGAGDT